MVVPGIGGPGLKRSDRVTCFQRWISRYIVYQLHTHAMAQMKHSTRTAPGLGNLMDQTILLVPVMPGNVR